MSIRQIFFKHTGVRRRDDAALTFLSRRKWLAVVAVALLLGGSLLLLKESSIFNSSSVPSGSPEEQRYDLLQRRAEWADIVSLSTQQPPQSLACRKVAVLARYRQGMEGGSLRECLTDTREVLTSQTAALMMSDVYMQLGFPCMAQRAAFEALVKTESEKLRERPLRRLAETALVMGQGELARKYLTLLLDYRKSHNWARELMPYAHRPELIEQHPVYSKLRHTYEQTNDEFFL